MMFEKNNISIVVKNIELVEKTVTNNLEVTDTY